MAEMGVAGNVVSEMDGQPIADAKVLLMGPDGTGETKTGKDGSFFIEATVEGDYEMTVSKTGYEEGKYGPLRILNGMTLTLRLALQPLMV